jgi:hypothetical protein
MGEFYFTPKVESQKKESEKAKLAYIPKAATVPKVSLRKEPKFIGKAKIKYLLKRYDFFDSTSNPFGSFENDFIDNNNNTITDRTTGLMWQRDGSSKQLFIGLARSYLKRLNKNKFAGYSDWRLPTIEELASLLEERKVDSVHVDSLFTKKQKRCWSADKAEDPGHSSSEKKAAWTVDFQYGKVKRVFWNPNPTGSGYGGYYITTPDSYVRAVRSMK